MIINTCNIVAANMVTAEGTPHYTCAGCPIAVRKVLAMITVEKPSRVHRRLMHRLSIVEVEAAAAQPIPNLARFRPVTFGHAHLDACAACSNHTNMPRYLRWKLNEATYFFTVVTQRRRPLFSDSQCRRWLGASFRKARKALPFEIDTIVLLPDH